MTETIKPKAWYVLGVDPGTTTGLAVVKFYHIPGRPELGWQDELPWDEAADKVRSTLAWLGKGVDSRTILAVAACEEFTINSQTAQRGQSGAADSLGMNGVVRHYAHLNHIAYAKPESASSAKKTVSDPVLKALDLYAVGMKHASDAARHCVLHSIKAGWLDRQLLLAAIR